MRIVDIPRERIVFNTHLWERCFTFVSAAFGTVSGRYLAVHWRRGDFVAARRPDVVKTAIDIVPRIKSMMSSHEPPLEAIYLSTGQFSVAEWLDFQHHYVNVLNNRHGGSNTRP